MVRWRGGAWGMVGGLLKWRRVLARLVGIDSSRSRHPPPPAQPSSCPFRGSAYFGCVAHQRVCAPHPNFVRPVPAPACKLATWPRAGAATGPFEAPSRRSVPPVLTLAGGI